MNPASVFHRSQSPWCHAADRQTLVFRVQTGAGEVERVTLAAGDSYDPAPLLEKNQLLLEKTGSDGDRDWWEARWLPPFKRARYGFRLGSGGQEWQLGDQGLAPLPAPGAPLDYLNLFHFPYLHPAQVLAPPAWVADTVWYQIFPDRFHRAQESGPGPRPWASGPVTNHQVFGGDIPGIIEKLDYLRDLGFTGLYLTPVFEAPSVHKYDTADYTRVDPGFGTTENLRHLVEGCHRRGMRILLDGVFNHCGTKFGPWVDVVRQGSRSPYAGWFHIDDYPLFKTGSDTGNRRDANFDTFSHTTRMPKLNTENPEAREFLLSTAEKWTRDLGIDGWRLDVANEVDHGFWREFRARIKAVNPESYLVGEIWGDGLGWLGGDQFDGVMNYPYGGALVDFLRASGRSSDGPALGRTLGALDFRYPVPALRGHFNLVDSHDTVRLVTQLGDQVDLARLGWFLLAFLPGAPCYYYGSEVGLAGAGDPDNRRCMPWDPLNQNQELSAFFRNLTGLRADLGPLLKTGSRRILSSEDFPGAFGWHFRGPGVQAVVLVNRDPEPAGPQLAQSLELDPSRNWRSLWPGKHLTPDLSLGGRGFLAAVSDS